MFTKISLIFSRIQKEKLGDGDVQVSDVLDAFNKIKSATILHDKENDTMDSSVMDEIPQIVAKEYLFDLKSQNLIDSLSLLNKLHTSFNCNKTDSVSIDFIKQANTLIVISESFNDNKLCDSQLAKLLFSENTHQLHIVEVNDTNATNGYNIYPSRWENVRALIGENSVLWQMRRDENYHIELFLGHLKILSNSRDELSLAKILCGTGGILKHDAFDLLKKESMKTKMPMYQV